ncbi:MAG: hypothetical protein RL272_266 [Candidatus Parcubacteria bacterium]
MQAASAAILLATMAAPAYAHGNGERGDDGDRGGRGFGLGIFASLQHGFQAERQAMKDIRKALRDAEKDAKHDDDDAKSACLKAAEEAYAGAIKAANAARETALAPARAVHAAAIKAAMTARLGALSSARTTFLASDMGSAAQAAFIAAYVKADADWRVALKAAQDALAGARATAEGTWTAAKLKATADFKAAKDACGPAATPAPAPSGDTTAPAAVVNLSLSGATSSAVTLSWTAPGDDNAVGTAASYDIRYSTSPITAANFAGAAQASGEPAPAVAGTSQSMTVSGLAAGTTYFFAMKTSDEAPNVSAISNVPSLPTLAAPDTTAPAAVTNLSLSGATASSITLSWTAPGDDNATGTAASYDVRYSTSPIATAADFASAAQAAGEPSPMVAGSAQSMTVSGLTTGTAYFFAIKAQDEVPNVSAVSNAPSLSTL